MQALDTQLFFWINHGWSHPWLDVCLVWITHLRHGAPLIALLLLWLLTRGGKQGRVCVLALVLALTVTDRVADSVLKPSFDRTRPCIALEATILRVKRRKSPSCPSSHAANVFAAMVVLGLYFRRSLWIGLPIALAVAVSRVYVGVHYPFDVLFGALFGALVGLGAVWILRRLGSRFPLLDPVNTPQRVPEGS